jgi:hypothetical protein
MNQDQWGAHRSQAELRKFGSHPCRETESSSGTGAHKRGNETKKNKLERASERKDRTEAENLVGVRGRNWKPPGGALGSGSGKGIYRGAQ